MTPEHPVSAPAEKYSQSILVLMVTIAIFVLGSSAINFVALLRIQETSKAIKSCTVTTGECYKDANRRTGGAIQSINKYTIAANLCADKYDGDATIIACIERTIKEGQG